MKKLKFQSATETAAAAAARVRARVCARVCVKYLLGQEIQKAATTNKT